MLTCTFHVWVLTTEDNLVHLYSLMLSTYLTTLYIQRTTLCMYLTNNSMHIFTYIIL